MALLKIWQDGQCTEIVFEGTPLISEVLAQAGISTAHPCGGRGVCGKCTVQAEGQISEWSDVEKRANTRLSCQTRLLGDSQIWLAKAGGEEIETSGEKIHRVNPIGEGFGCAIDIGTTTLALKLFNLSTGRTLDTQTAMNPQRSIAADVMGRIGAAMDGQGIRLKTMLTEALDRMLTSACAASGICRSQINHAVVTGNTTMLYLLTGRDPECLSHAPFTADTLFGVYGKLLGMDVYYPDCMNAFVGADITCAVLASGMHLRSETALLCDIGTNGEIALWKDGKLYVTSTAAGPAFEGAGISCGCGSLPGAIDRVWIEDGRVISHTIQDASAVGVCGSGLIDAIAAFLETGAIDETGAVEEDVLPLRDGIVLLPKDVRAVQLAKAAIGAGIKTLLDTAQVSEVEVRTLYIAGGFGSHLNVESSAAIGLIPKSMKNIVVILGNAALTGAAQLLMDRDKIDVSKAIAENSEHLNLGGNPVFNMNYMEQMLFADELPDD